MFDKVIDPRLQQRIAAVAAGRRQEFTADRDALVCALESAVAVLKQAASSPQRNHLRPVIETYEWALDEINAMALNVAPDTKRVQALCRLLQNVAQESADTVSVDRGPFNTL